MKLTVVMPTYNRSDLLGRAVGALLEQTASADDYEIVVVDDGSTDATPAVAAEVTAQASHRVRYLRQENRGPAAARNLGTREARGEIILYTGDDCLADRRLIETHLRVHETEGDVGVVGHVAWHPELTITPFMAFLEEGVQFGFKHIQDPDQVTAWSFYTANCSVRRHWVEEAGWFDEDFKYAAYEDIELAYRMQKRGLRIVYRPAAITYHYHPTTLRSYLKRQRLAGRSAVLFAKKHPEAKEMLGIHHAALASTAVEFFEAATAYAYALGVREALKEEPAPLEDEPEVLFEDEGLAAAGDAWQHELFHAFRGEKLSDAMELVRLRKQVRELLEEWDRVTSRRLYRWSEALAKAGWSVLRALGVGRRG